MRQQQKTQVMRGDGDGRRVGVSQWRTGARRHCPYMRRMVGYFVQSRCGVLRVRGHPWWKRPGDVVSLPHTAAVGHYTYLCPTRWTIIPSDLHPLIDTLLVERMSTVHQTHVVFGLVIVQTYQALQVTHVKNMVLVSSRQERLTRSTQFDETLPSRSYFSSSLYFTICRSDLSISSLVATCGLTWPSNSASSLQHKYVGQRYPHHPRSSCSP